MIRIFTLFLMASILSVSVSQARTYNCSLRAQSELKHQPAIPKKLRLTITNRTVIVSDAFIRATGFKSIDGRIDRRIGNDQLFTWTVDNVPTRLMPQERTWYRPSVNYRARLNTSTGALTVRGDFVSRYTGGASGTDMRAFGSCR